MNKMIIVDDEKIVREGLKSSADWEIYGINIVGCAENGKEALELIRKEKPEIILTDIYMPEMDGLELINIVSDIIPHAKSILMSGFKDFKYAQTAIRNNAFDYILKPIEIDYLIEAIKKVNYKINEELSRIKNKDLLEKQLKESRPVLRERYLDYILTNRLTLEEVKEQYDYIKVKLKKKNFVVMVIELEDINNEYKFKETNMISIKNALEYLVKNDLMGEVLSGDQQRFIIILNYCQSKETGKILEYLQNIAQRIKNHINNLFNIPISIGIGGLYKESENISLSYREASEALKYRMFVGRNSTIYIGDVSIERNENTIIYPVNLETKIITSLKVGDKNNINIYVKKFINVLLNNKKLLPKEIKDNTLQFVYTVLKSIIEWNLFIDLKRDVIEDRISKVRTSEELEDYLIDFLFTIVNEINEKRKGQVDKYVKKACDYMKENYHREIGLQDIANSVFITPQYLSKIFKKEIGNTVICYLTEFRMKKARQLLQNTDLKVYEVAERVGFSDSRYFSRVFKKHINLSPKRLSGEKFKITG